MYTRMYIYMHIFFNYSIHHKMSNILTRLQIYIKIIFYNYMRNILYF